MSESHDRYLPIVRSHVQQMGWADAHIEAQLGRGGERCDVFARAAMPATGILKGVTSDVAIDLWAGMTSVHEFKWSVGDLHADADKPWRRRDRRALGDHRFIWLHMDGPVLPKHVDEEGAHYGWGVVAFNESGYSVCRPSRRFAVAYYDTITLISELRDREKFQALERLRVDLTGVASGALGGGGGSAVSRLSGEARGLLDLVEEYLGDGTGTAAMIARFLRQKHGKKITPSKLGGLLIQDARFHSSGAPGGSWSLASRPAAQGVTP